MPRWLVVILVGVIVLATTATAHAQASVNSGIYLCRDLGVVTVRIDNFMSWVAWDPTSARYASGSYRLTVDPMAGHANGLAAWTGESLSGPGIFGDGAPIHLGVLRGGSLWIGETDWSVATPFECVSSIVPLS